MKYIKLLWFDVCHGLLRKPLYFIIPVIVAFIACIDMNNCVKAFNNYSGTKTQVSFADFIMYIYGGEDKYVPEPSDPFLFPARWMVVLLPVAFITLNYPYKDMQAYGQQILIRTKGRTAWWLSKCGWNIVSVLVYHGLIFLTTALFCAIMQVDFTGRLNKELIYAVFGVSRENIAPNNTLWPLTMLFLPILVSLGMNLFQMALSLFIKPMFSFFVTAFLMILSAYFTSPYLVGNYAMPLRYDVVMKGGVSANIGVIFLLVMVLGAVIGGSIRFHRYDILNRD